MALPPHSQSADPPADPPLSVAAAAAAALSIRGGSFHMQAAPHASVRPAEAPPFACAYGSAAEGLGGVLEGVGGFPV